MWRSMAAAMLVVGLLAGCARQDRAPDEEVSRPAAWGSTATFSERHGLLNLQMRWRPAPGESKVTHLQVVLDGGPAPVRKLRQVVAGNQITVGFAVRLPVSSRRRDQLRVVVSGCSPHSGCQTVLFAPTRSLSKPRTWPALRPPS